MLTVSNYHYIRHNFESPFPSIFGLTPEAFRKQLLALKTIGEFIHPEQLVAYGDEILQSDTNYFLITFDDGLQEQYQLCKPILEELQIPALFFINSLNFIEKKVSLVHKIHLLRSELSPDFILNSLADVNRSSTVLTPSEKKKAIAHYNYDNEESAILKYLLNFKLKHHEQSEFIEALFPRYFNEAEVVNTLYMSEEQLQNIAKKGWLGSHSHSHFTLGLLSAKEIKDELEKTKNYLENLTNTEILSVSYPYGSEDACKVLVPQIAKQIGHRLGFTMKRGINRNVENMLALMRFDCNDLPTGKNETAFKNEYSAIYK